MRGDIFMPARVFTFKFMRVFIAYRITMFGVYISIRIARLRYILFPNLLPFYKR
ncbi:hypothetical protein MICA_466 [Micavibrio aeruginosavorus ARL-13]|uniref:Uncharacterized protein n=1 Tax=Micavibrio aeruginosavorus (strain ARL-13) TaxID=856793 RepID=G2KSC0_MICAA|nr:hypothetical protein MICA_466 [Micavibrio aeruginosavorus ARL-13]